MLNHAGTARKHGHASRQVSFGPLAQVRGGEAIG